MRLEKKISNRLVRFVLKAADLSQNRSIILLYILGIISFVVVLKLNIMSPMWTDDFGYSFIYKSPHRIQNISDVVYSQYLHYMDWGGRTVAHVMVQIVLMFSPLVQDILNSLVYVLFTVAVYYHIKGIDREHSASTFCLIHLLLWFFLPDYHVIFWIAGSINYLWCTLLILLFLLPYRLYSGQGLSKIKLVTYSLLMFLGGIIAGWTNENTSAAMVLMIVLWIIQRYKRKKRIPAWCIWGILGAVVGYLLLVLAPGNYMRFVSEGGLDQSYSPVLILNKLVLITSRIFDYYGFLAVMAFFISILLFKFNDTSKKKVSGLGIYLIGSIFPIYIMILSSSFPGRAWFGGFTFILIFFGMLYYRINLRYNFLKCIYVGIVSIFLISFVFDFFDTYNDFRHVEIEWKKRTDLVKEAVCNGEKEIIVTLIKTRDRHVLPDDIWGGIEIGMSKYYGIKIKLEK